MSDSDRPPSYQAFLLRCWQVSPATADEPSRWRFVLREIAAEPQELAFGTLTELIAFLQTSLQGQSAIRGGSPTSD